MINHTQTEAMGKFSNVLCQVGVTTVIAKFLILDISIDRDSPIVVGRGFLRTIGRMINTSERILSTFDGFCHQTLRAARSDYMRNTKTKTCSISKLYQSGRSFISYTNGTNDKEPDHHDLNAQDNTKRRMSCYFHKFIMSTYCGKVVAEMLSLDTTLDWLNCFLSIFTPRRYSLLWLDKALTSHEQFLCRAFAHEFYSTYEFDEVCADDELQTKKIIRFRLGGRAYSLTLLEFAQRLGLYQTAELDEEGFNVYFEGGVMLLLSNCTIFEGGAQDDHLWFMSNDDWVDEEERSWHPKGESNLMDLEHTTLRELIDSEGRLIPKDPQPGVLKVGILRPPRASMRDLYDRMGRMEICQEAIERGAYNPPGYTQLEYDQYY
ncbi:hypothetical protein Tco_0604231 [Tanacetum coccineum]